MVYKVLRFFGAIVVAFLYSYVVDFTFLSCFGGFVHFLANLSWTNWISLDVLRGLLMPVALAFITLIGFGLVWLVRGSYVLGILPVILFVMGLISDFNILFLDPLEPIVSEIGLGFWYYAGAIVTFFFMTLSYLYCTIIMLGTDKL